MRPALLTTICFAGIALAAPAWQTLPLTFEPAPRDTDAYLVRGVGRAFTVSGQGGTLQNRNERVEWRLTGAKRVRGEAVQVLPGKAHYFVGSDAAQWRRDIALAERVRFSDIYPGISLVYYGNQQKLEYDFLVAPGSDPGAISMAFKGVTKAAVDHAGDLVLTTSHGELRQKKPVAYQDAGTGRRAVDCAYLVGEGNTVTLRLGAYDRKRPLVIDPVLLYSSYFGGTDDDQVHDIAVRGDGIYLAGATESSNFAGASGYRGNTDAFVAKLNADASSVVYIVYYGGSGPDSANGLFVDAGGNAYIGGETASGNLPVSGDAFFPRYRGGTLDGFVAKLNPQGNALVYSTYLGGGLSDAVRDVTVDGSGNLYAVGQTNSNDFPATFAAFQSVRVGADSDVFVTKLNPQGSQAVYSTFAGGILGDVANAAAVASDGSVYVAGTTASVDFPVTRGAFQVQCGRQTDAFLMRLNPSGTGLIFGSCLGGSDNESGNGLAFDTSGNPYLVGGTESGNFLTSNTAFQRGCGDDSDVFVTKWTQDGTNLTYSTCLGGGDDETASAVAIDAGGNAVVTGQTDSSNFPVTADRFHTKRDNVDAFVARLNADGSRLLSSTFLGGDGDDIGRAVALDSAGNPWVAGSTTSNNFLVEAPSMQRTRIGETDIFLSRIRFAMDPTINPNGIVNAASFQGGVAPFGLATIFGVDLARGTETASGTPLPGSLAGTEVLINGVPAPLYYASPTQINFQMRSVPEGPNTISVNVGGVRTSNFTVNVNAASPGIFFQEQGNHAVAQNGDFSLNTAQNPVTPGSVVVVYLTGIGPVDNFIPVGTATPPIQARAVLQSSVTVGGRPAAMPYLGLTPGFVGLAQANIIVPSDTPAGEQPVVITVGGNRSNAAVISVGRR